MSLFGNLVSMLRRSRARRRALQQLSDLPPRLLHDLGIDRQAVATAIRQSRRAPVTPATPEPHVSTRIALSEG